MRKTVLSILVALVLTFTLLGCGETEPLNMKKVTSVRKAELIRDLATFLKVWEI